MKRLNKRRKTPLLLAVAVFFSLLFCIKDNTSKQSLSGEWLKFEPENSTRVQVLELFMKNHFGNIHTVIRNASFSQQKTIIADILEINTPLNNSIKQPFSYSIDELAFGITTSVHRLSDLIRSLRFWTRYPGIQCLVTFYHDKFDFLETVHKLFRIERIPCLTDVTFTSRYQERFLSLVNQTWTLFARESEKPRGRTVKWLLIGDDDTLWFLPNLVRTLNNYNYKKSIYLGDHSNNRGLLEHFGTYYAYGGGGIAFSRPVAQRLTYSESRCSAYKNLFGGDMILGKCVTEKIKVGLTRNDNFHQMDIRADATGYFESGIQGLVSIHHMFSWWSPVPDWMSQNKTEIVSRFNKAYQTTSFSFLKRYVWIDPTANQTLVLTLGYSVTIYNQSLTPEQIDAVEVTFCCANLTRQSRPLVEHKKTWYFKNSYRENGETTGKTTHLYQNAAPGSDPTHILVRFH